MSAYFVQQLTELILHVFVLSNLSYFFFKGI